MTTNSSDRFGSISHNALLIAVFSLLSRLIGILRDRLLASTFGAGVTLDAYYAAFKVPDFIFNTFVLGALASAFIPVYIRYKNSEGNDYAFALTQRVLLYLCGFLALSSLLAAVFAPQLLQLIAPGFDSTTYVLSVHLSRVMLITLVLFGASSVVGSTLQAERRFLAYAVAPVAYNIGIIAGIFLLVPVLGTSGLAWGVVLGSGLHFLTQVPSLLKGGFRWQKNIGRGGLKEIASLMVPRTLGLAAQQINQIITVSFVSKLAIGSLAAYTFATNLHSFPINVFGVSLAVAAFPVFSHALGNSDHESFNQEFSTSVRRVLFFVVPLAVLFLVERAQIVRVVLGSGAFDWTATIRTAQVLGFLALAMVADSLIPLAARAFYAAKDTVTPVVASIISIVVNIGLLITLRKYGLAGVGIAYAASSVVNLFVLLAILGKKLTEDAVKKITSSLLPILTAAFASGACAYGMLRIMSNVVNMQTFLGIFLQGLSAGIIGVLCYLVLVFSFGMPEVGIFVKWWKSITKYML